MVLANIQDLSLTDPYFASIWEAIDDLSLPLLVHPPDPPGADLMDMSRYDLSWSVGFMSDATLCFARMIFDGFLDLHPNIKLIASQGGVTLPYLVGRFDKGHEVELPSIRKIKAPPSAYLKRIWYDCIISTADALNYLVKIVGVDRVLYGTDYPHWVHDMAGSWTHTGEMPTQHRDAIRGGNAQTLFGL